MTDSVDAPILVAFRYQRDNLTNSALYRHLLGVTIDDIERGGPCAAVLAQTPPDVEPVFDALPLRFLGGVHRLVLDGTAADLARCYPSAGGDFDPDHPGDVDDRFLQTVTDHRDVVATALTRGVQTNEVGRCAALLLGFLDVAQTTGLPLRLLEIGASAGLNLRWDHYRYEDGADGSAWGDASSPLRFEDVYEDPRPRLDIEAHVVDRSGCDRNPIDATSDDGALVLRSFVWPDQLARFAALDAALQIAASVPVRVETADADAWLESELARPRAGMATVVYHSIVWQYLSNDARHEVKRHIHEAGESATPDDPVAWLRMEPSQEPTQGAAVTLTQWPGGRERMVALAGYHGRPVRPTFEDHRHASGAARPTSP